MNREGWLFLDTGKSSDQGDRITLYPGDVAVMRKQLPQLKLWQRLPEDQLEIRLSPTEATELLKAMEYHIANTEWDRDPYDRGGGGGRMWWHLLFRYKLIPYLKRRLAA